MLPFKTNPFVQSAGVYNPPLEGRDPKKYLLLDFNESPVGPPKFVYEALDNYLKGDALQVYPFYGDFLKVLANN